MTHEEIIRKLERGQLLLIDKATLALMLGFLRRDAEKGITSRAEILQTVTEAVDKLNKDF